MSKIVNLLKQELEKYRAQEREAKGEADRIQAALKAMGSSTRQKRQARRQPRGKKSQFVEESVRRCLKALSEREMTMKELRERIGLNSGNTSEVVKVMEERRLVLPGYRTKTGRRRKGQPVKLTDAGRAQLPRAGIEGDDDA